MGDPQGDALGRISHFFSISSNCFFSSTSFSGFMQYVSCAIGAVPGISSIMNSMSRSVAFPVTQWETHPHNHIRWESDPKWVLRFLTCSEPWMTDKLRCDESPFLRY